MGQESSRQQQGKGAVVEDAIPFLYISMIQRTFFWPSMGDLMPTKESRAMPTHQAARKVNKMKVMMMLPNRSEFHALKSVRATSLEANAAMGDEEREMAGRW